MRKFLLCHGMKNKEFDLLNLKDFKLKFNFKIGKHPGDLGKLKNNINKDKYYRFKGDILINGASEFVFQVDDKDGFIKLNYTPNKVYPPKSCLKPKNSEINGDKELKFYPLCSDDKSELMGITCLMCSILNCNQELFKNVLDTANGDKTFSYDLRYRGNDNTKLKAAIRNWFTESMPEINPIEL